MAEYDSKLVIQKCSEYIKRNEAERAEYTEKCIQKFMRRRRWGLKWFIPWRRNLTHQEAEDLFHLNSYTLFGAKPEKAIDGMLLAVYANNARAAQHLIDQALGAPKVEVSSSMAEMLRLDGE